ncbi:MAG TPA: kynureninase [Gemmataceae bacterium]|jgi:kynureninase|nr:kynureninase [Gemmataceae bacterium]
MTDLTSQSYPADFSPTPAFASDADKADPLRSFRDRFHLPLDARGNPKIYLCSNSLGLQPRGLREVIEHDLRNWGSLGVDGHFHGDRPWYTYQEALRQPHAELVGALADEVVVMNGLTVNLHLMLDTFYRPTPERSRILIDAPTFPSDLYAVQSHLKLRGRDPDQDLVSLGASEGETLTTEAIENYLTQNGSHIALVLWSGINFLTGQAFGLGRIAAAARKQGCVFGVDLAHAVGNVPLRLHDWDVDFAVWCTYKYVCAGPGAIAGCFVHARHGQNLKLLRPAGWWGNDPARRFQMQLQPEFQPKPGADGWQISNPPILALAPLRAALPLFAEAGMTMLRAKSLALTSYLEYLLDRLPAGEFDLLTPRDPAARGCQLSLAFRKDSEGMLRHLQEQGVVCDFRKPNVIRVAPAPLYNTFTDVHRFVSALEGALR